MESSIGNWSKQESCFLFTTRQQSGGDSNVKGNFAPHLHQGRSGSRCRPGSGIVLHLEWPEYTRKSPARRRHVRRADHRQRWRRHARRTRSRGEQGPQGCRADEARADALGVDDGAGRHERRHGRHGPERQLRVACLRYDQGRRLPLRSGCCRVLRRARWQEHLRDGLHGLSLQPPG